MDNNRKCGCWMIRPFTLIFLISSTVQHHTTITEYYSIHFHFFSFLHSSNKRNIIGWNISSIIYWGFLFLSFSSTSSILPHHHHHHHRTSIFTHNWSDFFSNSIAIAPLGVLVVVLVYDCRLSSFSTVFICLQKIRLMCG